MNENENPIVMFTSNITNKDITLLFEVCLYLSNSNELLGFYATLWVFVQIKFANKFPQDDLAKAMNISRQTYINRRTALEKLGFINVTNKGKTQIINFNPVTKLKHDVKIPQTGYLNYLDNLRKKTVAITPEIQQQQAAQIKLDGMIVEEAKKLVKKKEEAKKKDEVRFPAEDYSIVLNAYNRYKGLGLAGPEVVRAKHAIKQMFLAGRTVKNIVDCMKFFKSVQDNPEYGWVRFWTLETVGKKMPEFVAGKLKAPELGDDLPDL